MASVSMGACSIGLDAEGFAECIEPARRGFLMPVGALPDADSDLLVRFVVMLRFYQDTLHSPMNISQKICIVCIKISLRLTSNQALNFLHGVSHAHVK